MGIETQFAKGRGELVRTVHDLGRKARANLGERDLVHLKRLKLSTFIAEIFGRLVCLFVGGPWGITIGGLALAYYFSVEAQLNHSIMHGAYAKIPGAGRFTPNGYETLAVPFQSKTWRDAHRIHHAHPSILGEDPDTLHPLFRVHADSRFRFWHRFNAFIGSILVFEWWAFDYDQFLKKAGKRAPNDHDEIVKVGLYIVYHLVLFPVLAGARWAEVLLATLGAMLIRNLIFTALQTASSVGHQVSTAHAVHFKKGRREAYLRFQVETSKNFMLQGIWRILCGGLDRHIEHHLFPDLPPNRLHDLSYEVRALCNRQELRYSEYRSVWHSLGDSLSYLQKLSHPSPKSTWPNQTD